MAVIVLADDDRDVRAFVKLVLEDRGDQCLDFSNWDDALAALDANPDVQLFISDLCMPAAGGAEVTEILKKRPRRLASVPVLLVSGMAPEGVVDDIVDQDRCRFLQKPFLPGQLYEVVDALLEKGGQERNPLCLSRGRI